MPTPRTPTPRTPTPRTPTAVATLADSRLIRSSASTPSLRSRDGTVPPHARPDPGGNVRVVVRVRAFLPREIERGARCLIQMDPVRQTTTLLPPADDGNAVGPAHGRGGRGGRGRRPPASRTFAFDRSFWSHDDCGDGAYAAQEDVYNSLGEEFLDHNFEGYHTCILAYGQTGSGKSYTMMGTPSQPGLIPRTCEDLFERIEAARAENAAVSYDLRVSYFEIYNEHVRDLLAPPPLSATQGGVATPTYLRIRESPTDGPYVQDLIEVPVRGGLDEMLRLMQIGDASRTTASTRMNDASSRSHAVFTIMLKQMHHDMDTDETTERSSRIRLVDLAGSERANATGAEGARLREGANINRSLTTLGRVIAALADPTGKVKISKPHKKQSHSRHRPHTSHGNNTPNHNSNNHIDKKKKQAPARPVSSRSIRSFRDVGDDAYSGEKGGPAPEEMRSHRHRRENVEPEGRAGRRGAEDEDDDDELDAEEEDEDGEAEDGSGPRSTPAGVVPYRDSILTWLLKDSLGGNSKTAMIACVAPGDYEETLSTLRYADQARRIRTRAVVNQGHVSGAERDAQIATMAAEIRALQQRLVVDDAARLRDEERARELDRYRARVADMQRLVDERSLVDDAKLRRLQTENDALRTHLRLALDSLHNPIRSPPPPPPTDHPGAPADVRPDDDYDYDDDNDDGDAKENRSVLLDDEGGATDDDLAECMRGLLDDVRVLRRKMGDDRTRFLGGHGPKKDEAGWRRVPLGVRLNV